MNIFQQLAAWIKRATTFRPNQLKAADKALGLKDGTLEAKSNSVVPDAVSGAVASQAQSAVEKAVPAVATLDALTSSNPAQTHVAGDK